MKNRWILALAFAGIFVLGSTLGFAADRYFIGAIQSNGVKEKFQMSVGVSASGDANRPGWIIQDREVLNVPAHYGRLVTVSSDREMSIFWYQDDDGQLRNVVVDKPGDIWYAIKHVRSSDLKVESKK